MIPQWLNSVICNCLLSKWLIWRLTRLAVYEGRSVALGNENIPLCRQIQSWRIELLLLHFQCQSHCINVKVRFVVNSIFCVCIATIQDQLVHQPESPTTPSTSLPNLHGWNAIHPTELQGAWNTQLETISLQYSAAFHFAWPDYVFTSECDLFWYPLLFVFLGGEVYWSFYLKWKSPFCSPLPFSGRGEHTEVHFASLFFFR